YLGNYRFGYDITDWDTNRKRWEVADAQNNRKGGYSITDVDGKIRYLEYIADKAGFRAVIRTNEPGTAPAYSGDALYLRDGSKQIITSGQPALQSIGHVITQKELATHVIASTAHVPMAIPKAIVYQQPIGQPIIHQVIQPKPTIYQQPTVQPVHIVKPIVHQPPFIKPALQVYQNVQPVVHVAPKPVIVQQPIIQQVVQPVVHHSPVVYQQSIAQPVHIGKTVAYQMPVVQPVKKVHFQTYQHLQPLTVQKPKIPATAPVVVIKNVKVPVVQKVGIAQHVLLDKKKIVVTPPPVYTGPQRRLQKFVQDPSQSYEIPELPKLTPRRVPSYNPSPDDFEDDYDSITVAPPMSRSRLVYTPDERDLPVSKFTPFYIRAGGITTKLGLFPPLAGPPSRRARA
ncbi:hypothetical protein BIW11_02250, partial [Tropilaelaps mercedesae]